MLVAKSMDGRLVNALDCNEKNRMQVFYCPGCQGEVRLKRGRVNCPHFAHVSRATCHFRTSNESQEHLSLKAILYRTLSRTQEVEVEKVIDHGNQIIDVFVSPQLALEVQCSPLLQTRLAERTASYHCQGLHVIWLLGQKLWLKKSLTALQRQFLSYSPLVGFYLWELDKLNEELRLKYLIHETLDGQAVYLSKSWSLSEDLMAALRFPFQSEALSTFKVACLKKPQSYIQKQLFYKNPKWLRQQEMAYQEGKNLLTQENDFFFPQIKPAQISCRNFQKKEEIERYYRHFQHFYKRQKNQSSQTLYSPVFYDKMEEKFLRRKL